MRKILAGVAAVALSVGLTVSAEAANPDSLPMKYEKNVCRQSIKKTREKNYVNRITIRK